MTLFTDGEYTIQARAEDNAGQLSNITSKNVTVHASLTKNDINISPAPTVSWYEEDIDLYVSMSGDEKMDNGVKKMYKVTDSSTFPTTFTTSLPNNGHVKLSKEGTNYIHVYYEFDNGRNMVATEGPYNIDKTTSNRSYSYLEDSTGVQPNWTNEDLKLVMYHYSPVVTASDEKYQYKVEGYHTEWQTMMDTSEGNNKWIAAKYPYLSTTSPVEKPTKALIKNLNKEPMEKTIYADRTTLKPYNDEHYITYLKTNAYFNTGKSISFDIIPDNSFVAYVNDEIVYSTYGCCSTETMTLDFSAGWNKVEFLFYEHSGSEYLKMDKTLSSVSDKMTAPIYSTQISLEGESIVRTRVVDKAGNASQIKTITAKIDKTKPVIDLLDAQKNTDGTYKVAASTEDDIAGINSVVTNTSKTAQKKENGTYTVDGLTNLPSQVTITDKAGNTTIESLEPFPTTTFLNGYSKGTPTWRDNVIARLEGAGALTYRLGFVLNECSTSPCDVTIENNTTITAISQSGHKTSSVSSIIDNIDKSPIRLVLDGERGTSDTNRANFKWSPTLSGGTITCIGPSETKSFQANGENGYIGISDSSYQCKLEATIGGESLISNEVTIYPKIGLPTSNTVDLPTEVEVGSSVFLEESYLGKTYYINTTKSNVDSHKAPLPPGIFN